MKQKAYDMLIQAETGLTDLTGVPENEIESQIKLLLSNVRAQDSTILDNIFEGTQLGSTGARPLKGRKKLDPEIRALLGEVKDPIKKLESTLISQNKILSELQWLSDVNKFVLSLALDNPVSMTPAF